MLRPVAPDAISNQIKDGLKGNYSFCTKTDCGCESHDQNVKTFFYFSFQQ